MPAHWKASIERVRKLPGISFDNTGLSVAPAFVLQAASSSHPNGIRFSQVQVSYAATSDGSGGECTFTVSDLNPADVRQFSRTGIIRLDAGYDGGDGPPVQPVFYGNIKRIQVGFEAGRHRWSFTCSAGADQIYNSVPNLSEGPMLTADAAKLLCQRVGLNLVSIPPVAYGDFSPYAFAQWKTPTTYAPNFSQSKLEMDQTVGALLEKLAGDMREAIRDATGLQRNIVFVKSQTDPFSVRFIDLTGSLQTGTPGRKFTLSMESPTVYSGGLTYESFSPVSPAPTPADDGGDGEGGGEGEADTSLQTSDEFEVAMVFDPRIQIGDVCTATGRLGKAEFIVQRIVHDLVALKTTIGGQLTSNPLIPVEETKEVAA